MTNKNIENVDILEELEYSFKTKENEIINNEDEIISEINNESSNYFFGNDINFDFLNQDEVKTLDISDEYSKYTENESLEEEVLKNIALENESLEEEILKNENIKSKNIIQEKNI
jgi:hypothetical protein